MLEYWNMVLSGGASEPARRSLGGGGSMPGRRGRRPSQRRYLPSPIIPLFHHFTIPLNTHPYENKNYTLPVRTRNRHESDLMHAGIP